jgi:SAM-dependent methyltransferase
MSSVHIPYETKKNKWFEYEQQWKVTCLNLLNNHVKEVDRGNTNVLDFGSGRGEFLQLLKDNGYPCQGVDFDPECVRLCSQITLSRLADEASLPKLFEDKSFDVVSCIHVLEHLRNPAELVGILSKISRQYLLLAVPNLQSTSMIVARGKPYTANEGHVCGWDHAHFRNFLENICELKILSFGHDLVPFTTKFSKIDQLVAKVLPERMLRNFEKGYLVKKFPYLSNTIIALCQNNHM